MRESLSKKYVGLNELGLEIAPFHNPWSAPGNQVINLDVLTNTQLRKLFPEMSHKPLADVHILDNANYLKCIPDESMDFVLSSHSLEHMENVGIALYHWMRVLKKGKPLLMAVPLKDNPIDKDRSSCNSMHIAFEYLYPNQYDLADHYREYYKIVNKLSGKELDKSVERSVLDKTNIHFHCWDEKDLKSTFEVMQPYINYELVEFTPQGHECFVVLRKEN